MSRLRRVRLSRREQLLCATESATVVYTIALDCERRAVANWERYGFVGRALKTMSGKLLRGPRSRLRCKGAK